MIIILCCVFSMSRSWYNNDNIVRIVSAIVTLASCAVSIKDHMRIHVVTVESKVLNVYLSELCPMKCTGTLLTKTIVLSVASCTENPLPYEYKNSKTGGILVGGGGGNSSRLLAANSTSNITTIDNNVTGLFDVKAPPHAFEIGDIKIYAKKPTKYIFPNLSVNVTEKILHPEWDPKSFMADLVLLKLEKRFYLMGEMPEIMENNLLFLPTKLFFRGQGKKVIRKDKIVEHLFEEVSYIDKDKMNYVEMNEQFNREFTTFKLSPTHCPAMANGKLESDINWWSFMCIQFSNDNVGYYGDTLLCDSDRGGPLYEMVENAVPKLYGVFSHRFHPVYPMCSNEYCSTIEQMMPPCSLNTTMYYKFTALIGRYTDWLNYTIERMAQIEAPVMASRNCPKIVTSPVSGGSAGITTDSYYDVDRYDDRARVMVSNQKVCNAQRNNLQSSADWSAHRGRAPAAIHVFAAAVVHVALPLWRSTVV